MKESYTHLVIILDRSGSMQSMRDDVTGGFNTLIQAQKAFEGEATLTLAQFDNHYEIVHDFVNINEVPNLAFQPRGGTALLDAMGKTINEVRDRILSMSETEMPSKVIFVTITDGQENASKEHTKSQVFEMIEELKSEGREDHVNWEFVFIGANQDAISEGSSFGIRAGASLSYMASGDGATAAFDSLSQGITSYRGMKSASACYSFSEEDRKKQENLGVKNNKTDMRKLAKDAKAIHAQAIPLDLNT